MPPEKIKTDYEEISVFRQNFKATDKNELAKQAEVQIKNSVDELGILKQAKVNTAALVTNFLKKLSYENIVINYGPSGNYKLVR